MFGRRCLDEFGVNHNCLTGDHRRSTTKMCEVNILATGCFGIRRGLFPVSIFSSACGNQEIRVAEQIKERKLREETEQKRKREARARKE